MADELDVSAIEARVNAATKGPWRWQANEKGYPQEIVGNDDGLVLVAETFTGPEHFPAEAEFIAHARTDLPALVAALRAAETKLAAIHHLAHLWTASDNVDDLHTRTTNRAYAGVLLDVLTREGEPT
jgi:hypothetical protein